MKLRFDLSKWPSHANSGDLISDVVTIIGKSARMPKIQQKGNYLDIVIESGTNADTEKLQSAGFKFEKI